MAEDKKTISTNFKCNFPSLVLTYKLYLFVGFQIQGAKTERDSKAAMANSPGTFQQFQDAFLTQQYTEPQFYQSPVPVQQVYYNQSPAPVDQTMMYVNQGTTYYQEQPQWHPQQPPPPQHHRQQHPQHHQGPPQQRPHSGQRGGRSRGRGNPNRSQSRQKYQEFHQRFQHEPPNPDLPVESLRPQVEDHRVEQDITYHDVLGDGQHQDGNSRGGARPKQGGRGNSQRSYSGRQYEPRQYSNQRSEQYYGRDNRGSGRGGRGRGGNHRGDNYRNQQGNQGYHNGVEKSGQGNNFKNNQRQENFESESPSTNAKDNDSGRQEIKKGGKPIKFRDFHSGAKGGNSNNKTTPRGRGRGPKRVNLKEGDLETQRGEWH